MSNLYRVPSKDQSYQVSIHLAKWFQRSRFFRNHSNQKQELPVTAMFVNGSELNEQTLQRTFQRCFLPNFDSFGQTVTEEKIFQKSTNQKQELPVVAMFINVWELNAQSLQMIFQGCFLPSFDSFANRFQRRRFFRNQPIRNKNCLWRPCFLTDRN